MPCASIFCLPLTSSCSWHHSDDTLQVGRERPRPKASSVAELGLEARAAAPGACRYESQKQMFRQSARGNSSREVCRLGLARPQTLPPHHWPPPTQDWLEDEARAQGTRAGPGSPPVPAVGRAHRLPAPCHSGLEARLEAAVTPTQTSPQLPVSSYWNKVCSQLVVGCRTRPCLSLGFPVPLCDVMPGGRGMEGGRGRWKGVVSKESTKSDTAGSIAQG